MSLSAVSITKEQEVFSENEISNNTVIEQIAYSEKKDLAEKNYMQIFNEYLNRNSELRRRITALCDDINEYLR